MRVRLTAMAFLVAASLVSRRDEARPARQASPPAEYPVVQGEHELMPGWTVTLPKPFYRRLEKRQLVMWRTGLTFWIIVWDNDRNESAEARLAQLREWANPRRQNEKIERAGQLVRFTYELQENDPRHSPQRYTSISGYVIGPGGYVQISAYCDDRAALASGYQVIRSVRTMSRSAKGVE
jgi:hypothetical protein